MIKSNEAVHSAGIAPASATTYSCEDTFEAEAGARSDQVLDAQLDLLPLRETYGVFGDVGADDRAVWVRLC